MYFLNTDSHILYKWSHNGPIGRYGWELSLHEAIMVTVFGDARCCKSCLRNGLPKEGVIQ